MTIPDDPDGKVAPPVESFDAAGARPPDDPPRASLGAVVPIDPRGRHDLLRLAGGLAHGLHSPTGDAIAAGVVATGIEPAPVERVVSSLKGYGVIALVGGILYALGVRDFMRDIGVRPHDAELRVADRIERAGDIAFFVVAIARAHCVGVIGAPRQSDAPNTSIIRSIR
ncbi:MAG TPA: hypothetical protein VF725_06960 [Ktedonobacterales bacterium]